MSKATTDLWLEISRWRAHLLYASMESGDAWRRASIGVSDSERGAIYEFDPAARPLIAAVDRWAQFAESRKAEPDVFLKLSQLRVMAGLSVSNREGRDKGFAKARQELMSTLDAWWEQFKQEHDKEGV